MTEASCHCGAVRLSVATAPAEVTDCNCSICRRLGALWAYYDPARVSVDGATQTYVRADGPQPGRLAFHRCGVCGCVTHWSALEPGVPRMGVNARLMAPEAVAAARVRRLDGADTWKELD